MSDDEFSHLREIFNKIDTDHSGTLEKNELVAALNNNKSFKTKQQI